MKTLVELIREAQTRGGTGLRLVPGYPMELKAGRQWIPFGGQTLAAQDVRGAVWALLTTEEKKQLDQDRVLDGWLRGDPSRGHGPIRFQYLMHEAGLTGSFSWHLENEAGLASWSPPPYVIEKMQRQSGLSLVTGPVDSGKSSFLRQWARTLVEMYGTVLFFADAEEFDSEAALPILPADALLKMSGLSQLSRFVVIDSGKPDVHARALELAAQGLSVFLSLSAKSIPSALMMLAGNASRGGGAERIWPLIGENLVTVFGLRLISGLEGGMQPVFELLVDTPEIKMKLSQGNIHGLVEVMAKGGDKSGMRTLNQALLQLLMKRKIELRTGFDESPNPLELDELLKKVGV